MIPERESSKPEPRFTGIPARLRAAIPSYGRGRGRGQASSRRHEQICSSGVSHCCPRQYDRQQAARDNDEAEAQYVQQKIASARSRGDHSTPWCALLRCRPKPGRPSPPRPRRITLLGSGTVVPINEESGVLQLRCWASARRYPYRLAASPVAGSRYASGSEDRLKPGRERSTRGDDRFWVRRARKSRRSTTPPGGQRNNGRGQARTV